MTESSTDMKALTEAFQRFTESTQRMEESYRRLEQRLEELDQELAEKNRELAFTSDYLENLLQSMSDGVIAVDTEGRITAFNLAASRVLGYTRDEVVGKDFAHAFGREFSLSAGRHAMELRAKLGDSVPVSESDSPIADRDGKHIGAVKVFQDLTEIEALRQQVRRKDRLAALGEMAATVAHEIRNPLGGIRGFAALLGRDLRGNESASRLVDKILRGTANLERVVNELLEYTRPVDLRRRPTPCRELVEAAAGYIDPVPENVEFVNEVDEDLRMLVDPDKMRQVLLNILLNAAQSIDGAGCVSTRSESGGGTVSLFVTDTGRGMDEDELGRIFTPFYTTKEKGTGLGLAIALKIVESHGGALVAESQPGRGSTFALRLPAAP